MIKNDPPKRVYNTNNSADMIRYNAMLTKDSTPYNSKNNLLSKSSLKRNFTISYNINATNYFPNILNNTKKTTRGNTRSNGKSFRYIYN